MAKTQDGHSEKAPGHSGNQGPQESANRPSVADSEERHQLTREQVPGEPLGPTTRAASNPEGTGGATGDGASAERDERIRRRAYQLWEEGGWQDGQAQEHWDRAAQDLDREEAEHRREGAAGEKARSSRDER